jgi:hypothetical protein
VALSFNGDTTETHYYMTEICAMASSTLGAGYARSNVLGTFQKTECGLMSGLLNRDLGNKWRWNMEANSFSATRLIAKKCALIWNVPTSVITSITMSSTVANTLAAGSSITLLEKT